MLSLKRGLLISALLVVPSTAHAQHWIDMGTDSDGDRSYIDRDSLRMEGSLLRYWEKVVYRFPKSHPSGKVFTTTVSAWAIKCAQRSEALTTLTRFAADGTVVASVTAPEMKFKEYPPGSKGASQIKLLCEVMANKQPPSQVEDRPRPVPTQEKSPTSGTGFFVSPAGHLVTNAHVVAGCKSVQSQRGTLSVISADDASDLALLKLNSADPQPYAKLRSGKGTRPGEAVVAVGYPLSGLLSSDPIVTTGVVSALAGLKNDRRYIQISVPVQPGNSGGPLHGESGAVIGVVTAKLNALAVARATGDIPQNVNFAVSFGTLQSFLDAGGVPYEVSDNSPETPSTIAARAAAYTVLLVCNPTRQAAPQKKKASPAVNAGGRSN